MTFKELGLIDPILRAIEEQGYTQPTPIQLRAIPILLKKSDLLGCAQTGTGKTAAFSIPIIQHLEQANQNSPGRRKIRALIVTPTRELAIQIDDNLTKYAKYTRLKNTVIYGGVKQGRQVDKLKQGVDILVATPGRLLDLIDQGFVSLREIQFFVLDEADQMLDMGFIHDIKKLIAKLPEKRQSLFFSATMPKSIVDLSKKILGRYESVTIKPQQATAERVEQAVYFVNKQNKINLLIDVINERKSASTLVFSRTKHGADKVVRKLLKADIKSAAIHGNKAQNNRQRALNAFKEGKIRVLIATDIAARGIDVADLALVINFDLPNVPETYVHRIGRTGRASASGIALSFCMPDERPYLASIQKLIKQEIPVITGHAYEGMVDVPVENSHQGGHKRPSRNNKQSSNNKSRRNKSNRPKNSESDKKEGDSRSSNNSASNKKQGQGSKNRSSNQENSRHSSKRDQGSDNTAEKDGKKYGSSKNKKRRSNSNKAKPRGSATTASGKKKPDRGYLRLLD